MSQQCEKRRGLVLELIFERREMRAAEPGRTLTWEERRAIERRTVFGFRNGIRRPGAEDGGEPDLDLIVARLLNPRGRDCDAARERS